MGEALDVELWKAAGVPANIQAMADQCIETVSYQL